MHTLQLITCFVPYLRQPSEPPGFSKKLADLNSILCMLVQRGERQGWGHADAQLAPMFLPS